MKQFVIKNKKTFIIIVIFLIVMFLLGLLVSSFFIDATNAGYGNRLDGIKEVEISKTELEGISSKLEEDDKVQTADTRISGKTINIVMTLEDSVSVKNAKTLATLVKEQLSEEEMEFYDVQLFVDKSTAEEAFPIIGYKSHTNADFTWTQER